MSSMLHRRLMLPIPAFLLAATAAVASLTPQQVAWYRSQLGLSGAASAYASPYATSAGVQSDPTAEGLVQWRRLRQSSSLTFQEYANFPDGAPRLARRGGNAQDGRGRDPARRNPARRRDRLPHPLSAADRHRAAPPRRGPLRAGASGRGTGGRQGGVDIGAAQQHRRRSADGHVQRRADAGRSGPAGWRPCCGTARSSRRSGNWRWSAQRGGQFYSARLAYQLKSPDASSQAAALGVSANGDAGYRIDRTTWLRETGQEPVARYELARPQHLDAPRVQPGALHGGDPRGREVGGGGRQLGGRLRHR